MSNLLSLESGMKNCHIFSLNGIANILEMDIKNSYNLFIALSGGQLNEVNGL